MNVLIIPSFFFDKYNPTSGSFFLEQARALQSKGHNVYIAYCDTYSVKEFDHWLHYTEKNETRDGVQIYRKRAFCPMKHGSGFYGCHERFAREIQMLYHRHLAEKKIDIIHAHCCVWAGYTAMKLSEQTGIPYVITEHSTLYALEPHKIRGKSEAIIRKSFAGADSVICVSGALQKCIEPYCADTIELGNVVDCDLFSPGDCGFRNTSSGPIFLTVLYMKTLEQLNKKGMDLLVDSFYEVIQQYPNAKLWIGGDGAARETVESWVLERGLKRNTVFLGSLSRRDVAEKMRQCDIFVLPSRYETFGVVYAEAMACGKPVIATRTGGPDSFVTEETGILIDVESQEQLTNAMLYMAENHHNYDSTVIRSHIERRFSMEAVADQLEEIYQNTV